MVEFLPSKQAVAGSNPVSRSIWFPRARSSGAERSAHNRLVVGSKPTEPTYFIIPSTVLLFFIQSRGLPVVYYCCRLSKNNLLNIALFTEGKDGSSIA